MQITSFLFLPFLHNVGHDRWDRLWRALQLSPLINAGDAVISRLLQPIIHNRPGPGWHQMATPALGADKCGKSERAMTRNVWRGKQWKVTGKDLTAWRHEEASGSGAVVSPVIILPRLWQESSRDDTASPPPSLPSFLKKELPAVLKVGYECRLRGVVKSILPISVVTLLHVCVPPSWKAAILFP